MKPHGAYKLIHRASKRCFPSDPLRSVSGGRNRTERLLESVAQSELRVQRILDSLRNEIVEGGIELDLRIRRVYVTPREIYRLELALPELGYQRTTFLDGDALEELLADDDVREVVEATALA